MLHIYQKCMVVYGQKDGKDAFVLCTCELAGVLKNFENLVLFEILLSRQNSLKLAAKTAISMQIKLCKENILSEKLYRDLYNSVYQFRFSLFSDQPIKGEVARFCPERQLL